VIDYQEWQLVEKEKIEQLDEIVGKIERGFKIDLWEIVPELELEKSKKAWGMLDPQSLKEGGQLSKPQILLLPINPPQYPGFTFQKEYGQGPSWIAKLIEAHSDCIRPIITAQPFDYKPYPVYCRIFEASRKVYSGGLPPCTQWRVESLIAKYRMTVDASFKSYYSNGYYKLGKDYWAAQVMKALGFDRTTEPMSIEGRQLRHFLAKSYSLASFGLSEIVGNVIDASSGIPSASPTLKMSVAWSILDPYIEYLIKPLRSDLAGLSLKTISETETLKKLQLVLPLIKDKKIISGQRLSKFLSKIKVRKEHLEIANKLEAKVPLELILRLNSTSEDSLIVPKLHEIEKSQIKYAISENDEYSRTLYDMWESLYRKGFLEKKLLDKMFELSVQYTGNIQEIAAKKLKKKVKVEKVKIAAGAFGSGFFAFHGLTGLSTLSFDPSQSLLNLFWASETTFSFMTFIKEIKDLLNIDQVSRDHILQKSTRTKNIAKGNIVDFEMIHSLKPA
jgi:hypothetical protein